MEHNEQTKKIISDGFNSIIARYPAGAEDIVMTDILLQANAETGKFAIYDDCDNEIFSAVVEGWANCQSDNFNEAVEATLREYIGANKDMLEALSIIKPYSFVLVDEDRETVAELHLVDDQLLMIDSVSLMENLDKDLDDFLEKLMKY